MAELFYTYAKAATLLYDLIDTVIDESDPDAEFPMNDVFHVTNMKGPQYVSYEVAGLDRPEEREPLEDLAPVNYKEGEKLTKRPINWGAMLAIPNELVEDLAEVGPGDGEIAARIGTFADFTRQMKYTAFWRADTECASFLLNGTSTAARYADRYGDALFSATHTSLSNPSFDQSNVSNSVTLTENALNTAITALGTQKDQRGAFIRRPKTYTLVVSPQNETRAWQLVNSEKQVDSANNAKNRLYSMRDRIKVVTWNELGASYTGWFVFTNNHGLNWKWKKRPEFKKEPDLKTNSVAYGMTMRGVPFVESWRGAIGYLPA